MNACMNLLERNRSGLTKIGFFFIFFYHHGLLIKCYYRRLFYCPTLSAAEAICVLCGNQGREKQPSLFQIYFI